MPKNCPPDGLEAAAHFLSQWFAGCAGLVELRYKSDNRMMQEWFSLGRLQTMAHRALHLSRAGSEVYFSVASRRERKGRKASVLMVPGFFADLDFATAEAGGIGALERLDSFQPTPTALVHTGGGVHAYWKLHAPLPPDPTTQARIKALVQVVGADRAATDVSRVLRVPGTWSWKRQAPVRLLRCACTH